MKQSEFKKLVENEDHQIIIWDTKFNKTQTLKQVLTRYDIETLKIIKIKCPDCKKITFIKHDSIDKRAYCCALCETLNVDWLICSFSYAKNAIKAINEKDYETAKNLIGYLEKYWFNSNVIGDEL